MENRQKGSLIVVLMIGLELLISSTLKAEKVSQMRLLMGTLLQIEVEANADSVAVDAIESAFSEVDRLEKMLSNYLERSEISRINRDGYPKGVNISQEMKSFIKEAIQLSHRTEGAFDITVEPLTQIWKLRERSLDKFPSTETIEKSQGKVGFKNLELSLIKNVLRFKLEGMGIDTGGIGKGYALDRALEKIRKFPVQSAALNFGGEILYWSEEDRKKVSSIKNPLSANMLWGTITFSIGPKKCAVSTSANYERYVTVEGERNKIGHILNPKTGQPVANEIRSITVIAPTATIADAYSTALFVMGLEEGKKFLERNGSVSALFLYEPKEGELKSLIYECNQFPLQLN